MSTPDIYFINHHTHYSIEIDFPTPIDEDAIRQQLIDLCEGFNVDLMGVVVESGTPTHISVVFVNKRPPAALIAKMREKLA
jgi:hypothetical protein